MHNMQTSTLGSCVSASLGYGYGSLLESACGHGELYRVHSLEHRIRGLDARVWVVGQDIAKP